MSDYIYIDSKVTVWDRVYIPKEYENDVISLLNEGNSTSDVMSFLSEKGVDVHTETLYNTMEELTPDKNGGYCTIEVSSDCNVLFSNGK